MIPERTENQEEYISKLETEIIRLEEWQKEYKKWSKSDNEIRDRLYKENKELKHKLIVSELKSKITDPKNNKEETIIRIMIKYIKDNEMQKRAELVVKTATKLSKEDKDYVLIVGEVPSKAMCVRKPIEEIEHIWEMLVIAQDETTETLYDNVKLKEIQTMLKNSQYSYMTAKALFERDEWQIIDIRNNQLRFEDTPAIVYDTIKEITKNK